MVTVAPVNLWIGLAAGLTSTFWAIALSPPSASCGGQWPAASSQQPWAELSWAELSWILLSIAGGSNPSQIFFPNFSQHWLHMFPACVYHCQWRFETDLKPSSLTIHNFVSYTLYSELSWILLSIAGGSNPSQIFFPDFSQHWLNMFPVCVEDCQWRFDTDLKPSSLTIHNFVSCTLYSELSWILLSIAGDSNPSQKKFSRLLTTVAKYVPCLCRRLPVKVWHWSEA